MRGLLAISFLLVIVAIVAGCGATTGSIASLGPSYLVYVRDRQGSVVAAVDDRGVKVWETHDDAYGLRLSSSGTEVPREFLDQPFDEETGFYHFQYRTYDPATAQWLSPDPMLISNPGACTQHPALCNPYAYGGDRPGEWPDPDGRWIWAQLTESGLTIHATIAVYGTNANQVAEAIEQIQAKVLAGSGVRLDVTVRVCQTPADALPSETRIDANIQSHASRSVAQSWASTVLVGRDASDASKASDVLAHDIGHLAGPTDHSAAFTSRWSGQERSASFPSESSGLMSASLGHQLSESSVQEAVNPQPDQQPNQGLTPPPGVPGDYCGASPSAVAQ